MAASVPIIERQEVEQLCGEFNSLDGVMCEVLPRMGLAISWNEWQLQFYRLAKWCDEKGLADARAPDGVHSSQWARDVYVRVQILMNGEDWEDAVKERAQSQKIANRKAGDAKSAPARPLQRGLPPTRRRILNSATHSPGQRGLLAHDGAHSEAGVYARHAGVSDTFIVVGDADRLRPASDGDYRTPSSSHCVACRHGLARRRRKSTRC